MQAPAIACGGGGCTGLHRQQAAAHAQRRLQARATPERNVEVAKQYYERVWSAGRVTELDTIMAEEHAQLDMVRAGPACMEGCVRTRAHLPACMLAHYPCVHAHTNLHACTSSVRAHQSACLHIIHASAHARTHTRTHARTHARTHTPCRSGSPSECPLGEGGP